MKPKFCLMCGTKLRSMYPGGSAENGPKRMACKEHGSPEEWAYGQEAQRGFGVRLDSIVAEMDVLASFADLSKPLAALIRNEAKCLHKCGGGLYFIDHELAKGR